MSVKTFRLVMAMGFAMLFATGCVQLERAGTATKGDVYASAKSALPSIKEGTTRIYVYRPGFLVGFLASPIVIINSRWTGEKNKPNENLFLPGCVFVVDSRDPKIDIWLYQAGREEVDKKLSLAGRTSNTYFIRYKGHPTYVELESVNIATGLAEIEGLHLSGYLDFAK